MKLDDHAIPPFTYQLEFFKQFRAEFLLNI